MRAGEHVTPQVRLVRPIGAGGMGSVWVAEHLALKTEVAVKFILAGREHDGEARERFTREAEAAAQVKSPHVTQIFDHGLTEDGVPFIVMELLEGEDLARYLGTQRRLTMKEASTIVTQICRALARAHARGLIHRDVKPANIFLCDVGTPERFVKLLDFGVAKMVGGEPSTATKSGSVTGTPVYMAPEQLLGARDLDHRADLWSVGVVAYEMIVGRRPLTEENAAAIGVRLHTRGMPRASEGLPELTRGAADALDAFFARAWAIDPKDRYDAALTLAEDFEALVQAMPQLQGAESASRFFLPTRQAVRIADAEPHTLRDDAVVSNVTLASGRLQVAEPVAPTMQAPPSTLGPAPVHTESPLSKQVHDSQTRATIPEPKRSMGPRVAAIAALVVALGAGALFLRTRGGESQPEAAASSSQSAAVVEAGATAQPAPSPVLVVPDAAPIEPMATPDASAAPKPSVKQPVGKKPPVAPSASIATPPVKKLEDIE